MSRFGVRAAVVGTVLSFFFTTSAFGASILLSVPGSGLNIATGLAALGNTVTVSDPTTWDSSFDYSAFDVVAFQAAAVDPADIANLVAAVQADQVGVVAFNGFGAENTLAALGLLDSPVSPGAAFPGTIDILNNTHPITQGLPLGPRPLGLARVATYSNPGADTTTLANAQSGQPSLVVSNLYRVVGVPYYFGTDTNPSLGNDSSAFITINAINWAATPIPEPSTALLIGLGLAGLGMRRGERRA